MALRIVSTSCTKEKKELLNRIARALGMSITETVDLGIDTLFQRKRRSILSVERARKNK